jgi:ribosomal protein S15P/S13E
MQCRVVVKLTSKGRQLRDLSGDVMNCVTAAVGMEEQCLSLMQQLQDLREHLENAAA